MQSNGITIIPAPKTGSEPQRPMVAENKRQHALRAASELMSAFAWSDSAEGHEFWQTVHNRLVNLGKGAEPLR